MGYFLFSFYEIVYSGMDNTQNDEKLFFYFFLIMVLLIATNEFECQMLVSIFCLKLHFLPKNEVFYKENDDLELFLMLFFQCYILIGKK